MSPRGSILRMRLSIMTDLGTLWPTPVDADGKQTGPPGYSPNVFLVGKGMVDDVVLVGGMIFRPKDGKGRDRVENYYKQTNMSGFRIKWKQLVNDCHGANMEISLGLAPSPKTTFDDVSFSNWLFASSHSDREDIADDFKDALDNDLPGAAGITFDMEYLYTISNAGKPNETSLSDAEIKRRQDILTDFYRTIADKIAPQRVIVITGAKAGHKLTDEGHAAFDHALLHDWPNIIHAGGQLKKNILLCAMAYMYAPVPPGTLEDWHRAVLRYATRPEPIGYKEDRAHIPVDQFQLIVQTAPSPNPEPGILTDDEVRHRGWLARLFGVGLGLFPAKAKSMAIADELLNQRAGIRPEEAKSAPSDPAPPPGTQNQPAQMPITDLKKAFAKI